MLACSVKHYENFDFSWPPRMQKKIKYYKLWMKAEDLAALKGILEVFIAISLYVCCH